MIIPEAIALDTHRFVKRLTEGRFIEQSAGTPAEDHFALLNTSLATKADLEARHSKPCYTKPTPHSRR